MLLQHCRKMKLFWYCCSVVTIKTSFHNKFQYDLNLPQNLQHIFSNKMKYDDSFWIVFIYLFGQGWHILDESWQLRQLKTWTTKLNCQNFLKNLYTHNVVSTSIRRSIDVHAMSCFYGEDCRSSLYLPKPETMVQPNINLLTHFWSMFPFYASWKHPETFGYLVFSGCIKRNHWPEMGLVIFTFFCFFSIKKKSSQSNGNLFIILKCIETSDIFLVSYFCIFLRTNKTFSCSFNAIYILHCIRDVNVVSDPWALRLSFYRKTSSRCLNMNVKPDRPWCIWPEELSFIRTHVVECTWMIIPVTIQTLWRHSFNFYFVLYEKAMPSRSKISPWLIMLCYDQHGTFRM